MLAGIAWDDLSIFDVFINEGFADLCFCRVKQIVFGMLRGEGVLKLDGVVKRL